VTKTSDVAVIGICAAVYAMVGRLTDLGITFIGVSFWPAVVIPAIFAVLYGPWVGGIGAAIGIFVRDVLFHGDPLLSLTAGVTSNFAMFFIIGYVSRKSLDWKKLALSTMLAGVIVAAGLLLPTLLLPVEFASFTGLSTWEIVAIFVLTVVLSLSAILIVSRRWSEWRSYGVGSVIGQGVGALIVAIGVWGYSQLFYSATGYFKQPVQASLVPIIFVWTFVTEIPFVLLVGPPVIKACYRAFPSLRLKKKTKEREK
jgi:uncharacterized membrane protein